MKRILFILMCVVTLGLGAIEASEVYAPSGDDNAAPGCVNVGNVSAEASDGTVTLTNYNSYNVTVTWAVYGHRDNGSRSEVKSGVVILGTTKTDVVDNKTAKIAFPTSEQYKSYSVKISPQKCN